MTININKINMYKTGKRNKIEKDFMFNIDFNGYFFSNWMFI